MNYVATADEVENFVWKNAKNKIQHEVIRQVK